CRNVIKEHRAISMLLYDSFSFDYNFRSGTLRNCGRRVPRRVVAKSAATGIKGKFAASVRAE
ncbi:MAG: hypothetical protein ACR2OU_06260, partial [Thermomicrobiales bacterium]